MPMSSKRKTRRPKKALLPTEETYIRDSHFSEHWDVLDKNADAYRLYLLITQQIWYPEDRGENRQGYTRVPDVNGWDRVKKHRTLKFLVDSGLVETEEDPGKPSWVRVTDNTPSKSGKREEGDPRFFLRFRSPEFTADLQSKRNWTDTILLHLIWRQSSYYKESGKRKGIIAQRTAQPLTSKQFRTAIKRLANRGLVEYLTPSERENHKANLRYWKLKHPRANHATVRCDFGNGTTAVSISGSGFYDPTLFKRARTISEKGSQDHSKGLTYKEEGKEEGKEELSTRQPDGIHRGCNVSSSGITQTGIPGQHKYSRTVALQSVVSPPKAAFHHREDSFSSSRDPEDTSVPHEDSIGSLDSRSLVSPDNLPDSPGSPVESESVSRLFGVSRFFVDPRVIESWEKLVIRLSRLLPRNIPEDQVLPVLSSVYDHMEQRVLKQKSPDLNVYAYSKDLELTCSRFHGDIPSFTRWVDACTIQGLWKTSDLSPSQLDRVTTLHARTLLLDTDPPVLREIERIQREWDSPEGPEEGTPLYHLWMAGVYGEKELDMQMDPIYRKYPEIYEHQLQELRDEREKHMGLAGDSVKYLEPLAVDGYFRKILNLREFLTKPPDEADDEFEQFYEDHEQTPVKLPEAPVSREFAEVLCWIARHPESTLDEVLDRFNNI